MATCSACRGKGKRQVFDILFVRDGQDQERTCPDCEGSGEVFPIEADDTVTFAAAGEFGEVTGTGTVVRVYKNGEAIIEMAGQRYKTRNYELMSKAV